MDDRPLPTQLPATRLPGHPTQSTNLADILERVLDKGIVIAGDIQINLLDIELLTIKLRLLIASVERAREMGINWWESDPSLAALGPDDDDDRLEQENKELRERLERLEQRLQIGEGEPADSRSARGEGQPADSRSERGEGEPAGSRAEGGVSWPMGPPSEGDERG
jgi:Gas vesicle protein